MKIMARRMKECTQGAAHFVPGAETAAKNHVTVAKTLVVWILHCDHNACTISAYIRGKSFSVHDGRAINRSIRAGMAPCASVDRAEVFGASLALRRQHLYLRPSADPFPQKSRSMPTANAESPCRSEGAQVCLCRDLSDATLGSVPTLRHLPGALLPTSKGSMLGLILRSSGRRPLQVPPRVLLGTAHPPRRAAAIFPITVWAWQYIKSLVRCSAKCKHHFVRENDREETQFDKISRSAPTGNDANHNTNHKKQQAQQQSQQ